MRKRKATAEQHLRFHDKRVTAGLLASAGKFHLSEDVRDLIQERVNAKEQREYDKQLQKKDEFDVLFAKVQAVKVLNIPPEQWTQVQLRVMLRWLKRDGDDKIPSRKQDQLVRYYATCNREDRLPPPLPPALRQAGYGPPLDEVLPDLPVAPLNEEYEADEQELATLLAAGFTIEQEQEFAANQPIRCLQYE